VDKLITILGPTASGKSSLGIELAKEFNGSPRRSLRRSAGEIVSADSRQVFRGLNIGSGKVTKQEQAQVKHHLLDVVDPMDEFSVSHFQKLAFEAIDKIIADDKLPFLVGGTALYIYSVIDNYTFVDVPPNPKKRKELEKMSVEELQKILKTKTPSPFKGEGWGEGSGFKEGEASNPRRLIRAIEKLEAGAPIEPQKGPQKYDNIILGIDVERDELYKKIDKRVDERINEGMIEEVQNLIDGWPQATRSPGEGWLISLGLEYRWITEHLQGKWPRDEMIKRLKGAIHAFARKQMTWFKKDKRIHWVKNKSEAEKFCQPKADQPLAGKKRGPR